MPRKKTEIEKVLASQTQHQLGYQQCEWTADTRCRYPGTMSTNQHEGGPYYCRLHFGCKDGMYGAQIVDASRDYQHPTQEQILAEMTLKAKESLKAKGLERREGETPDAYRDRLRAFMKQSVVLKEMRDAEAA